MLGGGGGGGGGVSTIKLDVETCKISKFSNILQCFTEGEVQLQII